MEQLTKAWKHWDEQPSSRQAVVVLQTHIQRLTEQLGCTPMEFRDTVNSNRREGQSLEAAIENAIEAFRD